MARTLNDRIQDMLLGALTADAAALGLHWIYDQAHIRTIAPSNPEFRKPDASNYEKVPGYFAHALREVGDQSQYGEQALVMIRSLKGTNGQFIPKVFRSDFASHFGYGGKYSGYIDHATRETLNNMRRAEDQALLAARSVPFDGDPVVTTTMVVKVQSVLRDPDQSSLNERFEAAIRVTHDDDALVTYGFQVLEKILEAPPATGADDVQLPAIAKLPALIGALVKEGASDQTFVTTVEAAIRATNDNDIAVAYGQVAAEMMRAALLGKDAHGVVAAGRSKATSDIATAIDTATSQPDASLEAVTAQFGMACDLSYAIPSICHNLITSSDFTEATRRNIYAGGDSCGRSILLGAVMGAIHGKEGRGIPRSWIGTLNCGLELEH